MKTTNWICALALLFVSLLRLPAAQAAPQTATLRGLLKQSDTITALKYSPDGKMIATAGGKIVRVWNAQTGTLLRVLKHSSRVTSVAFVQGNSVAVTCSSASYSGDDNYKRDPKIRLWDAKTGKLSATLQHKGDEDSSSEVQQLAVSPGGRSLIAADENSNLRIWNVASRKVSGSIKADLFMSYKLPHGINLSDNGTLILYEWGNSHHDELSVLNVWDSKNKSLLWKINPDKPAWDNWAYLADIIPATDYLMLALFGSKITGDADEQGTLYLEVRDVRTGAVVRDLGKSTYSIDNSPTSLLCSPVGGSMAIAFSGNGDVQLRDVEDAKIETTLKHSEGIAHIAFSPDGKTLACAGDKVVRLWKISDAQAR